MRVALAILLAACSSSSPPPSPTAVTVRDMMLDRDLFDFKLVGEVTRLFASGECTLLALEGNAVVRCENVALRFNCRDHLAGHPISLLYAGVTYDLTCH